MISLYRTPFAKMGKVYIPFIDKSYDTASVNSICETGQIPKGLLYHNFRGKDELYLLCVKIANSVLLRPVLRSKTATMRS